MAERVGGPRVLMTGGIRSGKSYEAERRLSAESEVTYVATAVSGDDPEWTARIATHRARRPVCWHTIETLALAQVLRETSASDPPILIECVNTWLAGTMAATGCWEGADGAADRLATEVDALIGAWSATNAYVIAVTNEVGLSLVPTTPAGRWFAEALGTLNARLAAAADEVWFVVAGIPTRLR
jgi:adenosylcobinamide kinase/adenosylcobinamide-phosphate guanylyltransferase